VFDLKALRAGSVGAVRPPNSAQDHALKELAGREFRFAVPSVPSVRLPRDAQSLANIWKSIAEPSPQQPDPDWRAAVWTALTAHPVCIPLTPGEGHDREFVVVAIVDLPNRTPVLATVKVALGPKSSKYAQPVVSGACARVIDEPERMAEYLEELYLRALPEAKSAARRAGSRALWLGGDSSFGPDWRERIEAACAVMGLAVEIVEEPARHRRTVEVTLGASAPPPYVLVWRPTCRGAEGLVSKYESISPDGEIVFLDEPTLDGLIPEIRGALFDCGLGDPVPSTTPEGTRTPPAVGEERYYIKVGGSKTGDVLIAVPDCGHARWGSDARRNSPRALMGVERLEGQRPKALFLCKRCNKHRWRARF
jgi:hypothetical protein